MVFKVKVLGSKYITKEGLVWMGLVLLYKNLWKALLSVMEEYKKNPRQTLTCQHPDVRLSVFKSVKTKFLLSIGHPTCSDLI